MTEQCNFIDCEEEGDRKREFIRGNDTYAYCEEHDPMEREKLGDLWKEADAA